MSSAGLPGGAGIPPRYFCHQCGRGVDLTPSPDGDVICPLCHDGFVEELESPPPPPLPLPIPDPSRNPNSFRSSPFSSTAGPVPFFFPPSSPPSSIDLRHPSDVAFAFSDPSPFRIVGGPGSAPPSFDPLNFLHDHFHQLISGGASIQIVLEGGSRQLPLGIGGGGGGVSLGDYFLGPGLEQLIQQLAENDPSRYGTPPAAKSAIAALPDVKISEALLATDEAQCAVCMDKFEIGAEAKQMPCKHFFHKHCIIPWLDLHSSCPVCRFELPTDDPDHESWRAPGGEQAGGSGDGSSGAGSAGGVSGEGNASPRTRMVERRFRISLPWPFRVFGSQAEASSAQGGSQGAGGQNDGGGQNAGVRRDDGEARQEDLD